MAILEHEVLSAATLGSTGMRRHLFTRAEYYSLGESGAFGGSRVELIEGEIIDMAPVGPGHGTVTHPLGTALEKAFGSEYSVRNQAPLSLGDEAKPSEPQPDIAVVSGNWRDYFERQPVAAEVKLVVEVADSTLAADRAVKAALYAASGIPEYWIVNLVDNCVEVYRDPQVSAYGASAIYKPGDQLTPLHASTFVSVADFLR